VFDPIRDRVPLGEEKPSFSMLTNTERLRPKDKPLADLAKKTLERCRNAYAPVHAMLPPNVNSLIKGIERQQDALIAELYVGRITFGQYNVAMDRLGGEFLRTISGIPQATANNTPSQPSTKLVKAVEAKPTASAPAAAVRLALVIGNSNYQGLPKLPNPVSDARAIAVLLKQMGYATQLLLDASEQDVRRNVRKFAAESTKADIALVFYAGHGAQVNGPNYLLPVDMDIPHTEADIQLGGLKLDDLINSVRSSTKIVFLDACRDNPALFKNIVVGRGAPVVGLAPTIASNLEPARAGGGVFIAYATDSGAVALDGKGEHSPFTQALLKNLPKPISIDDMFSMVNREVLLVTKNTQRPYKYASLENIICLTPACSNASPGALEDIVQQAKQSEEDELRIALQTKTPSALETYLQKYPETTRRAEILSALGALKRSEFKEWTLYGIANEHLPQFMQLSSIQQFWDRVAARTKVLADPSEPMVFFGKPVPDAAYAEQILVFDCTSPRMALAEQSLFNQSGELLFHYKWADPQYLNLSIGQQIPPGSVGFSGRYILCHEDIRTPLVSKEQMAQLATSFKSLSSTIAGDGEILYLPSAANETLADQKEVIIALKYPNDHNIKDYFPAGTSIPNPASYRVEVNRMLLKCNETKFATVRIEFWDASNQLVRFQAVDPADAPFSEFQAVSPFATMQEIACRKGYVGVGLRFAQDNGVIKVAEVFDASPAAKAGVKTNDVVTHIDKESVSGLTLDQIIKNVRGPANTKVLFTIRRAGQERPFEVEVSREVIQYSYSN
jgi:hypothetical protein